jgi:prevent-host-death family protein
MTIVMTMSTARKRTLTAAEFKARCLAVMDQVASSGDSVLITKRGKPIARLVPAQDAPETLVGFWRDHVVEVGDVVAPIDERWAAEQGKRR